MIFILLSFYCATIRIAWPTLCIFISMASGCSALPRDGKREREGSYYSLSFGEQKASSSSSSYFSFLHMVINGAWRIPHLLTGNANVCSAFCAIYLSFIYARTPIFPLSLSLSLFLLCHIYAHFNGHIR